MLSFLLSCAFDLLANGSFQGLTEEKSGILEKYKVGVLTRARKPGEKLFFRLTKTYFQYHESAVVSCDLVNTVLQSSSTAMIMLYAMQTCTVLCCAVLCCAVLCCTVLYCPGMGT